VSNEEINFKDLNDLELDKLKDLEFTLASEPNGYGWKKEINKLINKRGLS